MPENSVPHSKAVTNNILFIFPFFVCEDSILTPRLQVRANYSYTDKFVPISGGCKRPSELHRHFEDTSPRVINQQLKELEMHGMIEKTIYPELPPHVEYSITDDGRSLIPIIRMLEQWGNDFRPKMVRILEKTGMAE